jgi:2-furoyl-CoA dehydrogenase large subunit
MSLTKTVEHPREAGELKYVGVPVPRFEDLRLTTGQGSFADDQPILPDMHYAAVVRSLYAHARIKDINTAEALKLPGVKAVITGKDVKNRMDPLAQAIRSNVRYYPIAMEKVRYVGEPVAVVVARDRFTAEDAMSLVEVEYEPLPCVVDPTRAMEEGAPVIHEEVGSNVIWGRTYRFGDPDKAFREAFKTVSMDFKVNRFTTPPLETYVILARYESASGILTEWCNFQGPFTFYYIASRCLRLTEDKFRVITPKDIGGGFGDKTGMASYMALIGVVAMLTDVPVKWVETRTEHFIGSTRAAGRVGRFELALDKEGIILALRIKAVDDVGAYPRSPEPGHLLRQLGNLVGPYHIRHVAVDAKVVTTNTVPTSPIRGFGGQHLYFPLEKLVTRAAKELGLDPAEIRFRNFVQPGEFPYETPTGGIYDSGNYPAVFRRALELVDYEKTKEEIARSRKDGRFIGLGLAVGVDPSVSNMGYLDTATPPEERGRAEFLPKSGGQHTAVVKVEPMGRIICQIDSCPQGQGHETAAAQIISSVLGVKPEDVAVTAGVDTHRNPWSISAGTYSSRFGSVGISAVYTASMRIREKMLKVASGLLGVPPDQLGVGEGKVFVKSEPSRSVSLRRIAGSIHWNPISLDLEEDRNLVATSTFHIPTLRSPGLDDRTNSSGTYGFIADAVLVEVDPETGMTKVIKYVSVHDSGTIINPGIVKSQCIGAANQGIEQTLYQDLVYSEDGQPLATNFGDYYVTSAKEAVDLQLDHSIQTKSPFTSVGSKGIGESNNETAPAAIALAIEDALEQWNVDITELPITPEKLWRKIEASKG